MKETLQFTKDKNLKLCEIFSSISGEGLMQGIPATFIRFSGCNMSCDYCDTKYHSANFEIVSVEDILNNGIVTKSQYFVVTGGEPFAQHEDIFALIKKLSVIGKVEIGTNGTNLFQNICKLYKETIPTSTLLTIDLKLNQNNIEYFTTFEKGLELIKENMSKYATNNNHLPLSCIKVIVKNKKEIDRAYKFSDKHPAFQVIVSPCCGLISPTEIAEYIVEKKYRNLRMQIQLHKYLWEANAREK